MFSSQGGDMDRLQRLSERILPHSAFGVTLLTISVMILIVGFFVRDIHLFSVEGELPEGYVRMVKNDPRPTEAPARSILDARFNTDPVFEDGSPLMIEDETMSSDEISEVEVEPSDRYAENRSDATPKVAPGYVALLTRTSDCRWAEDSEAPSEGTQFKVGQTLNVAAGVVEIAFACGAKAVLEGPAVLELQSEKSGTLKLGKLRANVPDEVEGFTVHTPMVQVVSLCTSNSNGVAKLTATTDCHWAKGSAATKKGASLLPGQAVKLLDGLAEITFASGAKVILEGPANFEIESNKTAILHSGRLTADVPDDLEGFKIRTPTVEILSLASESKGSKSKGAPESKTASADGPNKASGTVILNAGESVRVDGANQAPETPSQPPAKP
jgi:hypothetical protein